MDNFQNELQKQFFEFVSSNNRTEVIRFFREIEYKPWEYVDEEDNTAIIKSTFLDFTILTITMIDETKLRLGEQSKEVLKKWLNQTTKEGYTSIHYACFRGNIELIIKLTENHAEYNICNIQGLNCLHVAAQGNKPQSLMYMLEKFNMDINSKDKVGSTPLHWACYTGSENVLNFILARNPEINVQDKDGYTPLHLAVISERTRIIKKLLQFNAKKDIKSNNNLTPLQLAMDKEKYNIVDLLIDKSCFSQTLLFRTPLMKVQRSNGNVYFFFFIHFLVEFASFFVLLPCIHFIETVFKSNYIYIVYSLFFLQLLVIYIYLINSDPGVIKNRENESFIKILENKENILNYCPFCKSKKTKDSLHCFICDQCVDGFDHHCFWVNNCIGRNNYIMFIIFLFLLVFNLFLNIFVAIHAIVIMDDEKVSKFFPRLPLDLLYKRNVKFTISVIIIITCFIFIIPVLILIGFQIKTHMCDNDNIIIRSNSIIRRTNSELKRDDDEEKRLLNN